MVTSKKVLLLLILPVILVFPALYKFARLSESNAHDNWTKTFGVPIEDITRDFPSRSDSESAVRLKQLGIKLGIEFTTPGDTDLFLPIYKDANREKLLAGNNGLLASYIRMQLQKPNATIDPPSEIVSSYLTDSNRELEAVRDHILSSPPILWRQNLNHWDRYRCRRGYTTLVLLRGTT
ncbi:hypothetical protein L0152_28480 [bacterium]|nr:hypothetical protein [bacterium]